MPTTLTFQTVDDLTQQETLQLPEHTHAMTPVVVVAPALGIRASYYQKLAELLLEQGIAVCLVDSPGHANSPVRPASSNWGYAELVEHFAHACQAVRDARPGAPACLLGHSIGGQAALILSGLHPDVVDHVVLVASGSPFWRSWQGLEAYKLWAQVGLCGVIARALGVFPGDKLGFGGREARDLIVQWSRSSRTGTYDFQDLKGDTALRLPGPPVHAIGLVGDAYAPATAIKHTLDKITQRDISFELWRDAPYGGNHNRWPSQPGFVATRLADLLNP